MGQHNFLIEGVSASGKTSVCHELRRRGFQAINGDTELAYQGDPESGLPISGIRSHWHHIWDVDQLRALAADRAESMTFFCGGSRNFPAFIGLFEMVFVLEIDAVTLTQRLDERSSDEFGAHGPERDLVERLHHTRSGVPDGISIDATAPLDQVVDEIVRRATSTTGQPTS